MESIHTPAVIAEVRRLLELKTPYRRIAREAGVSRNCVSRVAKGLGPVGKRGVVKKIIFADPLERIIPRLNAHINPSRCAECGCKHRGSKSVCYECYVSSRVLK